MIKVIVKFVIVTGKNYVTITVTKKNSNAITSPL